MAQFNFNPLLGWADQHRNQLAGLGAGLLSGQPGAGVQAGIQADDAYATQQKAEAERQKAIADQQALRSRYADFFIKQGKPDIAKGIADGILDPGEEYIKAITPKAPAAPIAVGAGETLVDPASYKPLFTGPDPKAGLAADKENFDRESALWKEYMAAEPVKTYQALKNSYERIRQSAAVDSGPGDLGLIFNYMKMLDPGSVVREGEFATAENAGGVGQQIMNIYNKIANGERLTPELRQQFLAAAERLYSEASSNLETINTQMGKRTTGWGVDASRIITAPEAYTPLTPPGAVPIDDVVNKYLRR